MTYIRFIKDYINKQPVTIPICVAEISKTIEKNYSLPLDKAAAATSVAIKRIMDQKAIPELRFYQKGIYYKTIETAFGEMGIDKEKLIAYKYIDHYQGYETGAGLLHKLGLTTQMPNERLIATNAARDCVRHDKKLNISFCPPKTEINKTNKAYMQILDAIEYLDKAPVDMEDPYLIIAEYIKKNDLKYEILLSIADTYYSPKTILQLAHTAGKLVGKNEVAS